MINAKHTKISQSIYSFFIYKCKNATSLQKNFKCFLKKSRTRLLLFGYSTSLHRGFHSWPWRVHGFYLYLVIGKEEKGKKGTLLSFL